MMKMDFRTGIKPWFNRMQKMMAEQSIIDKYSADNKKVPEGRSFQRLVNKKLKEWNGEE